MTKRRLPIGLQTFSKVREQNCYYVDKTPYIERLLNEGSHYFLSRPRRFGKSLFLDTLKELFEGNEPLFAGLHIHDHWGWSVHHPVVRLDFAGGSFREPGSLHEDVMMQLEELDSIRLARLLQAHDCAGLEDLFRAFFASIPYQWYTNNHIADYEGFYASVFYSYFAALGDAITVADSSSHGRLDMALRTGGHVYLFEFKVNEMAPPGSALAQLRERGYAAKYRARGEPIHLIGVEFSRETRNLTAFEVAAG